MQVQESECESITQQVSDKAWTNLYFFCGITGTACMQKTYNCNAVQQKVV